jgi:hypothetical protein
VRKQKAHIYCRKLFDNIDSVSDTFVSFYHEIDSVDNSDENDKNRVKINV